MYSHQWEVIPAGQTLSITLSRIHPETEFNLDTNTQIWFLPIGEFKLSARFASRKETPLSVPLKPDSKYIESIMWQGKLVLPRIDFEITE